MRSTVSPGEAACDVRCDALAVGGCGRAGGTVGVSGFFFWGCGGSRWVDWVAVQPAMQGWAFIDSASRRRLWAAGGTRGGTARRPKRARAMIGSQGACSASGGGAWARSADCCPGLFCGFGGVFVTAAGEMADAVRAGAGTCAVISGGEVRQQLLAGFLARCVMDEVRCWVSWRCGLAPGDGGGFGGWTPGIGPREGEKVGLWE